MVLKMTHDPQDVLATLLAEIDDLERTVSDLPALQDRLHEMDRALNPIHESSSGRWLGSEAELYYGDFDKPPPGQEFARSSRRAEWFPRTFEEISQRVTLDRPGLPLDGIFERLNVLTKNAIKLREEIVTEISPIVERAGFEREAQLVGEIEEITWGVTTEELLRKWIPKQQIVYDVDLLGQPFKYPPHMVFRANVQSCLSRISRIQHSVSLARRVVRQLGVKTRLTAAVAPGVAPIADAASDALRLCDAFHRVAIQLQNRYSGRGTLCVNDEYDVQDLLHSLLKIFFSDVRREEWTPSYAGGSSRMDFLLKDSRVVVEVKKTRSGLGAREIGDQLIVDIAKYAQHPDCGTLICFVYDPDSLISNPRGLERDLNRQSTEELTVLVAIRPDIG